MKLNQDEKHKELLKYRALVLATIDYYLDNKQLEVKTVDFDSETHFLELKLITEKFFELGQLTRLKSWFRDLTEVPIEGRDFKFNQYIKEKTNYDVDIFQSFFEKIDKIVKQGKIKTNQQFYDVRTMVDYLEGDCSKSNELRIQNLIEMLDDFDQKLNSKK